MVRADCDRELAQYRAATAADGTFTVTDALPVHGTYTYTASYAGDAANAPATPATVTITGRPG